MGVSLEFAVDRIDAAANDFGSLAEAASAGDEAGNLEAFGIIEDARAAAAGR
jgi:hypothetical protein